MNENINERVELDIDFVKTNISLLQDYIADYEQHRNEHWAFLAEAFAFEKANNAIKTAITEVQYLRK